MADASLGGSLESVGHDSAAQRERRANLTNGLKQTQPREHESPTIAQTQTSGIASVAPVSTGSQASVADPKLSTTSTSTSLVVQSEVESVVENTVQVLAHPTEPQMASNNELPNIEAGVERIGQRSSLPAVEIPTASCQETVETGDPQEEPPTLSNNPDDADLEEVSLVPLPSDRAQPMEQADAVPGHVPQSQDHAELGAIGESPAPPEDALDFDHDGQSDGVLRLKPTCAQWDDFPGILAAARKLGATKDGCFKVVLPAGLLGTVPDKIAQRLPAKAYRPHQIKRTRIWQVGTVETEGDFPSSLERAKPSFEGSTTDAFKKLSHLFNKNKGRQMRDVRYRVDVPAWNSGQRINAGVPEKSPMHPLKGDKLDQTKAIIPGIHTPYVYESGPAFGATFQIHAEDYRLLSLNHLYKGRKIWVVIPAGAVDLLEEKLERQGKCSQFMRHRAEFLFPEKLKRLEVPFRIIDQRPGETIVILPDAYHEGFSTGYTLAEAKNYAEPDWTAASYQACDRSCKFLNMIPTDHMEIVEEGETRIDLCALLDAELDMKRKRQSSVEEGEEREAQRPRMSVEGISVA